MNGPIHRFPRQGVQDRRQQLLDVAWVRRPVSGPLPGLGPLGSAEVEPALAGNGPVLILAATQVPILDRVLLKAADQGRRVYLMVPPGWGKADPGLAARTQATVLVRRAPGLELTGLWVGGEASLWLGEQPTSAPAWSLRLEKEQAEAFRFLFLHLFWHQAQDEAWTGGPLQFRPVGQRPFDVPDLPTQSPLRQVEEGPPAARAGERALRHRVPPPDAVTRLWIPPSGRDFAALRKLPAVLWRPLALPELSLGAQQGRMRVGNRELQLSPAQVQALDAVLSLPGEWCFEKNVMIGSLSAGQELWLDGGAAVQKVQAEQPIPCGEVQAPSLRAADQQRPASWPTPHPLAQQVRYSWTVVPPRVPAGALEDALIGQWRKVDEDFSKRLEPIRKAAEESSSHQGQLKKVSRLVQALLGFGRTQSELERRLTALETQIPSQVGPSGAPGLFQQVVALEQETRKLKGDLEGAEQKAKEEEEKERQEADWRRATEEATRRRDAVQRELPAREQRLGELQKELSELKEQLPKAEEKVARDLSVRQKARTDELRSVETALGRLRSERAELERKIAEPFLFRPPATPPRPTSPGRFIPQGAAHAAPLPTCPDEALPAAGQLRNFKGQRYLVIDTWEDLVPGEAEADRLHASLVAPETI